VAVPNDVVTPDPHAPLDAASYCSNELHIPDGTIFSHDVAGHEQQTEQQGHAHPPPTQHPRERVIFTQELQTVVDEQQVVVEIPSLVCVVGPITFPLPGYALLLIFVGLNGAIIMFALR
jgi:hypothetical protein